MGEHLESRHQERGRPENSRWNKCAGIAEDELSMESRYYYQNSLQAFTDMVISQVIGNSHFRDKI